MTRLPLALALSLAVCACGDDDEPPAEPDTPPTPETTEAVEGDDPLEGLDEPVDPSEVVAAPVTGDVADPDTLAEAARGGRCVKATESPVRLWAEPGPAAAVSHGDGFVVAGYARKDRGTELWVVGVRPDAAPSPLRTVMIDGAGRGVDRIAPPALTRVDDAHVAVAVVDRGGVVRAGDLAVGAARSELAMPRVGEGADLRFAPAIAAVGRRRLVAWTAGGAAGMRVKLAVVLDGQVEATHDVTPEAMGASAPAFAESVSPPALFFIDARAGVSPIVRVDVGADGSPGEPAVAKPVGTVTTPPRLAVARGGRSLYAGYTVIGNAATTAVGWIRLDAEDASPAAIVPGTGYGKLNVAAVSAPEAAVFAADAPKGSDPEAPREVHLRAVRPEEAGPVLALHDENGVGRHAALARRQDGMLAVVFTGITAVYVAWARCDDA